MHDIDWEGKILLKKSLNYPIRTNLVLFIVFFYLVRSNANILGISYEGFFPTSAQTDYITVHSTESIRSKKWRMHFFGTLSGNNLLAYEVPVSTQTSQNVEDQLLAANFGLAYGITSYLEYGLSVPMHVDHNIKPKGFRPYLAQRWITAIHNQFKYVFKRRGASIEDESGFALVGSLDLPNTNQDGFLGDKQNPIATIEVVFDKGTDVSSYSYNAGYRWRSPGLPYTDSPVLPLQDQFLFSAAYQKQFKRNHKLSWIAEFYGAIPTDLGEYKNSKEISSAELLFGLRGGPSKPNRWTVGLGTELIKGSMSPDWRLFAGWSWDFSWSNQSRNRDLILENKKISGVADEIIDPMTPEESMPVLEDGDRDGVQDDEDMCPRTIRGFKVDREGCPFDSDGDSVPDNEDRCPNTPKSEVVNSHGCPALK